MSRLSAITGWIPRILLFALAGVIQMGLIAVMVYDRAQILREGAEVTLRTRPVDPRDFLRGDYVVLNYEISSLAAGALQNTTTAGRGTQVYVKLAPNAEGHFEAVSVHAEPIPVTDKEVLIRGRVTSGAFCGPKGRSFCDRLFVTYGIERFFVPEGEGRELENVRNQQRLSVVAAVTSEGRAAIKRLLLDGKPVYDEPAF